MNGVLGSWNLYASVPQAIYVNNNTDASVLTINVCNRNNVDVRISIAISVSATTPLDGEYIEYETTILGKGILVRTGVVVSPGQYVIVDSSSMNVAAVCWGVETGSSSGSPVIITQNSISPTWSTSATLSDITSSEFITIPLRAS